MEPAPTFQNQLMLLFLFVVIPLRVMIAANLSTPLDLWHPGVQPNLAFGLLFVGQPPGESLMFQREIQVSVQAPELLPPRKDPLDKKLVIKNSTRNSAITKEFVLTENVFALREIPPAKIIII